MFRLYKELKNGSHYFLTFSVRVVLLPLSLLFLTEQCPNLPCNTAIAVWTWGPLPNCNFLYLLLLSVVSLTTGLYYSGLHNGCVIH